MRLITVLASDGTDLGSTVDVEQAKEYIANNPDCTMSTQYFTQDVEVPKYKPLLMVVQS